MVVLTAKKFNPIIWIPPSSSAIFKVTVERGDGTIDDITDELMSLEIIDGVTGSIGTFNFVVPNGDESKNNIWTGMEIFRYYSNYGSTATTGIFRGRLEKISYKNNVVEVTGRSESRAFVDLTITASYSNIETSEILKDIIALKQDGTFTTNNIAASTTYYTIDWVQKPFWEAVAELCKAAGFDCYVDFDRDFNYFESGSRQNTMDAAVLDVNIVDMDDFANDISQVKNKIRVYGASVGGVQVLYTAKDTVSQTDYGVREEIVMDTSILSYSSAKDVGDLVLSQKKDPPEVGGIRCFLMGTLQPGDQILISAAENNLPPAYRTINEYTISIDESGLYTHVVVSNQPRTVSNVFKDILQRASSNIDTAVNVNELDYGYSFDFSVDSGTHTNTEIDEGVLKTTGGATGTWVSPIRTTSDNVTSVQLVLLGEQLDNVVVSVSANGGANYEVLENKVLLSLGPSVGTSLMIKVVFSSASSRVKGLNLLYS